MDDDFNTAEAVAELHLLAGAAFQGDGKAAAQLKALGAILGLLQRDPQAFLQAGPGRELSDGEILAKIEARLAARKNKDYAEAGIASARRSTLPGSCSRTHPRARLGDGRKDATGGSLDTLADAG